MDFKVWQQFWRLLGVDQFQINGIGAKYWEPDDSFVAVLPGRHHADLQAAATARCRSCAPGNGAGRRPKPTHGLDARWT